MIIYENTKGGFVQDVRDGMIAQKIKQEFINHNISNVSEAEYRAWLNSLQFMRNAIDDNDISDECNLAIEYRIPLTAKRVDFLIAGLDDNDKSHVVVVELKQWENSETTQRADIVMAYIGGAKRTVCHPSYQAYSYAKIIENFNQDVYENEIKLVPCAYLHNYREENRENIDNDLYKDAIDKAPIFLSNDLVKLRNFIKSFVRKKDGIEMLMKLENGKLKPAKALQDALTSMIKGNPEFYLIDEQKVAYETVLRTVKQAIRNSNNPAKAEDKYVVIIKGGPGTGKSVIAIKLLCELINNGVPAVYVTKNAAPRDVYFDKLKRDNFKDNYIKSLFKGPGSFKNSPVNYIDCIIADEAHRLKLDYGKSQVEFLIRAAKVTVFLLDEDQRITVNDLGSREEIIKYAEKYSAMVIEGDDYNLVSQFRCNGSDGYLNFLDNVLGIRETANTEFEYDYDVRLFNSPTKMREALREKNAINNKSRMIAGYCYEWRTKNNPHGDIYDIILEDGFNAKWNFGGTIWATDPNSFDQVGCIHTSQGLEFDYCGVIIGKDLRYENGKVITDKTHVASTDNTSKIRTTHNLELADKLIRNTYKTLLSRGQKGCYIYCEDKLLLQYMSDMLGVLIE